MILEDCCAEGDGNIDPEKDSKRSHKPGAGGRVAVCLDA